MTSHMTLSRASFFPLYNKKEVMVEQHTVIAAYARETGINIFITEAIL